MTIIGVSAFKKASLQISFMFEKILKVLTILNFLGIVAVFGGGYFGLQYVKSPQFQNKIKNQLMALSNNMNAMLDGSIKIGNIDNQEHSQSQSIDANSRKEQG